MLKKIITYLIYHICHSQSWQDLELIIKELERRQKVQPLDRQIRVINKSTSDLNYISKNVFKQEIKENLIRDVTNIIMGETNKVVFEAPEESFSECTCEVEDEPVNRNSVEQYLHHVLKNPGLETRSINTSRTIINTFNKENKFSHKISEKSKIEVGEESEIRFNNIKENMNSEYYTNSRPISSAQSSTSTIKERHVSSISNHDRIKEKCLQSLCLPCKPKQTNVIHRLEQSNAKYKQRSIQRRLDKETIEMQTLQPKPAINPNSNKILK